MGSQAPAVADGSRVDWNTGQQSGLVSIASHRLHLSVAGTRREPGDPTFIVLPGVMCCTSEWAAVERLASPFARILLYDRSGCGHSEESPNAPTSTNIALELDELLRAADVSPPYVIVGHSWGGILALEFLALGAKDIAGMIFVDACQPRQLEVVPFNDTAIVSVSRDLDMATTLGWAETGKLTPTELQAFLEESHSQKHQRQAALELGEMPDSFLVAAARGLLHKQPPILGSHPVCVVKGHSERDLALSYEAGVQRGNGTAEERGRFQSLLAVWEECEVQMQREFFHLSTKNRYLDADQSGHYVHITEPEVIVEGIKWILASLAEEKE